MSLIGHSVPGNRAIPSRKPKRGIDPSKSPPDTQSEKIAFPHCYFGSVENVFIEYINNDLTDLPLNFEHNTLPNPGLGVRRIPDLSNNKGRGQVASGRIRTFEDAGMIFAGKNLRLIFCLIPADIAGQVQSSK